MNESIALFTNIIIGIACFCLGVYVWSGVVAWRTRRKSSRLSADLRRMFERSENRSQK